MIENMVPAAVLNRISVNVLLNPGVEDVCNGEVILTVDERRVLAAAVNTQNIDQPVSNSYEEEDILARIGQSDFEKAVSISKLLVYCKSGSKGPEMRAV